MKLATAAAANWRVHCGEGGLGSRVFCSRAQRTQQTANILIAGATGATWRDLECVYPEPGMQARSVYACSRRRLGSVSHLASVFSLRQRHSPTPTASLIRATRSRLNPAPATQGVNASEWDAVNAVFALKSYAPLQAYLDDDAGTRSCPTSTPMLRLTE